MDQKDPRSRLEHHLLTAKEALRTIRQDLLATGHAAPTAATNQLPTADTARDPFAPNAFSARLAQVEEENARLRRELELSHAQLSRQQNEHAEAMRSLQKENTALLGRLDALRSEIVELRGLIRVVCRVRPAQRTAAPSEALSLTDRSIALSDKAFTFDRVFGPAAQQQDIFHDVSALVESVTDGYRVCVFAYGQTGSGKTYTMTGAPEPVQQAGAVPEIPAGCGLVYRAVHALDAAVARLSAQGMKADFTLRYLEIYNEALHDLISDKPVQIHDTAGTQRLTGCEAVRLASLAGLPSLMRTVEAKRRTAETACNARSSRSHALFILDVRLHSANAVRDGALVLVDLAGSERLKESKAVDERLKETQCINRSLSALSNVFSAIRRGDRHVPFHDSKLTHALREYLVGRARTVMIVNLSPESPGETLCSLRFAAKVSECALGSATRTATESVTPCADN